MVAKRRYSYSVTSPTLWDISRFKPNRFRPDLFHFEFVVSVGVFGQNGFVGLVYFWKIAESSP